MAKHLTEKERYQIEAWRKIGMPAKEIARLLGKCERTIYYELKRGKCALKNSDWTYREEYLADVGQRIHNEKKHNKGISLKIGNNLALLRLIEQLVLKEKYSPYAAIQKIRQGGSPMLVNISSRTVYNYIHQGIFLNLSAKNINARKRKEPADGKSTVALNNLKGTSIEQRPDFVHLRKEYGHWEMDTVVGGKGGKQCLLVLSERASREELIFRMPDKKSSSVIKVLNRMERSMGTVQFRKTFKTITCDNGSEFLNFTGIEQSAWSKYKPRTTVYYCHPYSAWERGTNENTNRLIRRFIPKGAKIEDYTDRQINFIQDWINHYPRKLLGGLSANQKKEELLAAQSLFT